jgi:hypothetical protein
MSSLEYTQIPNVFFTPYYMDKILTFSRYYLKTDAIIRGHDVITHAHTIMGNGVIITPTHDSAHPSRWYYQLLEIREYDFGSASNSTASTNFMRIHPAILQSSHLHRWTTSEITFYQGR